MNPRDQAAPLSRGAVAAELETLGMLLWPADATVLAGVLASVRDALGEARFASAWSDGYALRLERAISALWPQPVDKPDANTVRQAGHEYEAPAVHWDSGIGKTETYPRIRIDE